MTDINTVSSHLSELRAEQGYTLIKPQRKRLAEIVQANSSFFSQGGESTAFAELIYSRESRANYLTAIQDDSAEERPAEFCPKTELSKMPQQEIIEECGSNWSAPVVLVSKKDGSTMLYSE